VSKAVEISSDAKIYVLFFRRSQFLRITEYTMTSFLRTSKIFLPDTPYVSIFSFLVFLALAWFILTGRLKVWRYWLHLFLTHREICHLLSSDWWLAYVAGFFCMHKTHQNCITCCCCS